MNLDLDFHETGLHPLAKQSSALLYLTPTKHKKWKSIHNRTSTSTSQKLYRHYTLRWIPLYTICCTIVLTRSSSISGSINYTIKTKPVTRQCSLSIKHVTGFCSKISLICVITPMQTPLEPSCLCFL